MVGRRVVTGHANGRAVVVSDERLQPIPLEDGAGGIYFVWGRDDPASYPDDGQPSAVGAAFPPVGGCRVSILNLPPGDNREFHQLLVDSLGPLAEKDDPGMHRTASLDFDIWLTA